VLNSAVKLSIILSTLLSTFSTTAVPNLCDYVYRDASGAPITDSVGQTLSRFCEWAGPDAPVWNANVCCTFDANGAACMRTNSRGGCSTGKKHYCEYGEAVAGGGVICYQPLPSMCDVSTCVAPPDVPPTGQESDSIVCCSPGGACQWVSVDESYDCIGEIAYCDHGYQDGNGVVECWD
jgi:hypothetical protein